MTSDPRTVERQALAFEDDRGSSRSRWIAGALVFALSGWMGSGFVLPSEKVKVAETSVVPRMVTVAVRQSQAEPVTQYLAAEGQAQPDRDTVILTETSGEIGEVLVRKGANLERGEVIARFNLADREADLARAEAEMQHAQRNFETAETLLERGIATVTRVSESRAALAVAEAQLSAAKEVVDTTVIRAPFAGRLETLSIDEGEFVAASADVGRIVDNTPLTVTIQIPQQSLRRVKVGQTATVTFITGEVREGEVAFVGTSANAETRTFLAEIEVPNEDGAVPAGVSAQVRIPTGEVVAHFLSPAILSLDTDGRLGVKTTGVDDRVAFHPVEIIRAQTDGVWVTGLPEAARIITVGQGFVNDGEMVDPQPEVSSALEPAPLSEVQDGTDDGAVAAP
ncbi:efflux RND transporter periplasmic adaptor subunit [Martelella mediterranea]|uniref:efflux RND transporter periplasmic adaptor subunit n=1 Tax=Martelella mediterranea TaxID=293089 RepID=UPI001E5FA123|nr:efflux RND transporter periplasmic adaptor subunit [Martelella mediterranea]MCD1637034.1 efflux RND transporter periplasmic adaptor subunit [Martelella mediterranea]